MKTLSDLSDLLADAVETAQSAVVRVEARRRLPASGIVWSPEGEIVTAHHVVQRDEEIRIGFPDGNSTAAVLVGRDATTDLAVLRAENDDLLPASWAEGPDLRVGHLVVALGRPGRGVMASLGMVGALGGGWRTPAGGQVDRYLQPDLVMYPGFSGGLLINAQGKGVGLSTSGILRGACITIPHATLQRTVQALLAHGRIQRGYLGIGGQAVRLPKALSDQLGQATGVLLVSVDPDSPAGEAGLLLGDTIVAFANQRVEQHDDLLALLTGDLIGVDTPVRIVRGGQLQELSLRVGERP